MARRKILRPPNVDGLGPKDVKRLATAIRRVWGWNYARRLCLERAVGSDGFPVCEKCKLKTPKNYPDHIQPVGEFDSATFIVKMFVNSSKLQALCKKCHQAKTNEENALRRKRLKAKRIDLGFDI